MTLPIGGLKSTSEFCVVLSARLLHYWTELWQWMQDGREGIEKFDLLTISEDGEHLQLNKTLVQHLEVS